MDEQGTTIDEILALLGAKEVQLYAATKRIAELEKELSTNDTEDTDRE